MTGYFYDNTEYINHVPTCSPGREIDHDKEIEILGSISDDVVVLLMMHILAKR